MSSTIYFSPLRSWKRSIHCPFRSASAARFSGRASVSVSNRPICEAEAACASTARPPTNLAHDGIEGQAIGIVDVLLARQPPKDQLPEQTVKTMDGVLDAAAVIERT
jgi:hypothetical protein